jgi:hypothetical protein
MWDRFTNRYTWRELVDLYRLSDQDDDLGWPPSYKHRPDRADARDPREP